MWLNLGLFWKTTKIRTILVLVSRPKQVQHSLNRVFCFYCEIKHLFFPLTISTYFFAYPKFYFLALSTNTNRLIKGIFEYGGKFLLSVRRRLTAARQVQSVRRITSGPPARLSKARWCFYGSVFERSLWNHDALNRWNFRGKKNLRNWWCIST